MLAEAGIARADAVLAVTDDDKTNMLAAVRAKAEGCPFAIALINDPTLVPLMGALDIAIIGSDDTNGGLNWFKACVENAEYFAVADRFASHIYLKHHERMLAAPFFEARLELLDGRKPLVVAEFGFHDERTQGPNRNPVMQEYPYGLWAAAFALEGLNKGAAGFSIWCLQSMWYPNDLFMGYGLWDFGGGWERRPVYPVWKAFTARTEPGEPVYRVVSSHPQRVAAARVGDTLFWVNQCDAPAPFTLAGFTAATGLYLDAATVTSDRPLRPLEENRLPPRSFGVFEGGPAD